LRVRVKRSHNRSLSCRTESFVRQQLQPCPQFILSPCRHQSPIAIAALKKKFLGFFLHSLARRDLGLQLRSEHISRGFEILHRRTNLKQIFRHLGKWNAVEIKYRDVGLAKDPLLCMISSAELLERFTTRPPETPRPLDSSPRPMPAVCFPRLPPFSRLCTSPVSRTS
jgi:hypothetical protein